MRLNEHTNKFKSNAVFKSQDFGIGDASVVIEILRNRLYRHPIRTLVQEYICNGRDAMREVNSKSPIEITVPTRLSPTFKVRDFGPGITPKRMKDVFVMYGSSTKRDSDLQTGGFGIGAKSAWSYTDSFNIITYVDGEKRTYVAHTGVNNNGRLDHLNTEPTDEPNGTEIQIGVNPDDLRDFQTATLRTVYFWDESTYEIKGLVDGGSERKIGVEVVKGLEVVDKNDLPKYVKRNYYDKNPIVVLDGVPYDLDDNFLEIESLSNLNEVCNGQLILHVETGVLEVSASRESISDSKRSKESFTALAHHYLEELKSYLNSEFSKCNTIAAFAKLYSELLPKFQLSKYASYKGYKIERERLSNDNFVKLEAFSVNDFRDRLEKDNLTEKKTRGYSRWVPGIPLHTVGHWFYEDGTESKIKQNKRIRSYLKDNNTTIVLISKTQEVTESQFKKIVKDLELIDLKTVSINEVAKVVSPKIKRDKKEFCIHEIRHDGSRYQRYTTLAENTRKWLYVPMIKGAIQGFDSVDLGNLARYLEKTSICVLSQASVKLVKNDPNFRPLEDWLKAYKPTKEAVSSVKGVLANNKNDMKHLVGTKNIKDKFLAQMIADYATHSNARIPSILFKKIEKLEVIKTFKLDDAQLTKKFKHQYPLIKCIWGSSRLDNQELVYYINAKHKGVK